MDDDHLPSGVCDDIVEQIKLCKTRVLAAWAIGGDDVSSDFDFLHGTISTTQITEFPAEAGYPIGGETRPSYFMIQMHYDNPTLSNSDKNMTMYFRS